MRLTIYAVLLFALLMPLQSFADDLGLVRLSLTEGEVQVLVQNSTDWTDAAINLPLNEGDRLWVPDDGKAELQIRGGVYVRANNNTSLDMLTVDKDSAQLYLDQGHVYINNRRGGIKIVQVDTPLSSVRSYDNSIMLVDVSEDGVTEVSVLKGYAYAENRAGSTRVSAGNTLTIRSDNSADIAPIATPDDWEQWNTDRDRRLTAWGESSRYLPDELHEYSTDFDENGRWEYAGTYGYVWAPTVVAAGWAPYTVGRWIWIRGHYVWVAYDPWSWAPSHYGRWVYLSNSWCWVPPPIGSVYWGPGYVGWLVTPTYVAWVPLAPGEIYYGYGYYGPGSVNINTVNVRTIIVNRTYINARAANSVTIEHRESFGTGRRVLMPAKENPFIDTQHHSTNITIVPPPVKPLQPIVLVPSEEQGRERHQIPDRERIRLVTPEKRHEVAPAIPSPTPAVKKREYPIASPPAATPGPAAVQQLHPRLLPPKRVRDTRPEEMKNERRLVKDRESSVFKQEAPEHLNVNRSNEPKKIIRKWAPYQDK